MSTAKPHIMAEGAASNDKGSNKNEKNNDDNNITNDIATEAIKNDQQQMSEKMQRLIDMQYEQQQYSSSAHDLLEMEKQQKLNQEERQLGASGEGNTDVREVSSPGSISTAMMTKTPHPSVTLNSTGATTGTGGGRMMMTRIIDMGKSPPSPSFVRTAAALHGSSNTPASTGSPLTTIENLKDPTVGQGTLFFDKKKVEADRDQDLPLHSQLQQQNQQQPWLVSSSLKPSGVTKEEEDEVDSLLTPILTASDTSGTTITGNGTVTAMLGGGGVRGLTKSIAQHMHLASYGSVTTSSPHNHPPAPDPTRGVDGAPQNQQQQQQQHLLLLQQQQHQHHHHHSTAAPLHHDFYYGNPDSQFYHNSSSSRSNKSSTSPASRRRRPGFCTTCCRRCVRLCLVDPVSRACRRFIGAEGLHRSFCFGAIDGMLTGSGIVSTFCGLQLITQESHPSVHWLLVIFSLSACFADSVGMAIGHVWSTHVVHSQQARERSYARLQFQTSKPDAKGHLVDMLLQRGMLKIDAMSLADTLEGYPDLFVSALAGEALVGGGGHGSETDHAGGGEGFHYHNYPHVYHHPHQPHEDDRDPYFAATAPPSSDSNLSSSSSYQQQRHQSRQQQTSQQRNTSYGRMSDFDMDPESYTLSLATNESRDESLWMMAGFTLFAVLPALILHAVWTWDTLQINSTSDTYDPRRPPTTRSNALYSMTDSNSNTWWWSQSHSSTNYHSTVSSIDPNPSSSEEAYPFISPLSLAVTVGACVMWTLGVWKSRFLAAEATGWHGSGDGNNGDANAHHRNWSFAVFGFETVLVFGLCVTSAYGLGAFLKHLLNLPNFLLVDASSSKKTDDFW